MARRFELTEGSSNKYWEVALEGKTITVRFGKMGTNGQRKKKVFASQAAAQAEHDRLVAEKLKKGYRASEAALPTSEPTATRTRTGIAASLLDTFDSLTRRAPRVSVWSGSIVFPAGGLAKWRKAKLASRAETVAAYLERVVNVVDRGERWLDLAVEGDALDVKGWDWREDQGLYDALDAALEAAAPLQPKGSVTMLARQRDGTTRRRTISFRAKKAVIEESDDDSRTKWDDDEGVKAALAIVAPGLRAWLHAHAVVADRIEHSKSRGYIDRGGREVIPPRFTSAEEFSDGLAVVYQGWQARLVDVEGNLVKGQWQSASAFLRGRAPVAVGDTDHWGYADRSGTLVIRADYARAEPFYGPLAVVKTSQHRFMTPDGELVGDPFDYAHGIRFHEDRVWTIRNDLPGFGCIDEQGRAAIPRRFADAGDFSEGLAPVLEHGKTQRGYVDRTGAVVIEPRFDEAYPFSEGRALVRIGKEHRLINRKGELVGGPFVSNGRCQKTVSGGMIAFFHGGKIGFLTKDGDVAIKPRFAEAVGFFEDRAIAAITTDGGKRTLYGHIDRAGEHVIAPTLEWTNRFWDGLAPVKIDGLYGFVDASGATVVEPRYAKAQDRFCDGRAWIELP